MGTNIDISTVSSKQWFTKPYSGEPQGIVGLEPKIKCLFVKIWNLRLKEEQKVIQFIPSYKAGKL